MEGVDIVSIDDVFRGAKTGAMMLYAYRNGVGEVIGHEQALAIHKNVMEAMGAAMGQKFRQQAGNGELDAAAVAPMLLEFSKSMTGVTQEIVSESPNEVRFKQIRCPFFEARQELGMAPEDIEHCCNEASMALMDAMVKALNPRLSYRSESHRTRGDGFCYDVLTKA